VQQVVNDHDRLRERARSGDIHCGPRRCRDSDALEQDDFVVLELGSMRPNGTRRRSAGPPWSGEMDPPQVEAGGRPTEENRRGDMADEHLGSWSEPLRSGEN
jgi:hypothetical protein